MDTNAVQFRLFASMLHCLMFKLKSIWLACFDFQSSFDLFGTLHLKRSANILKDIYSVANYCLSYSGLFFQGFRICFTSSNPLTLCLPPLPQYYEMSYGLNIEMHKQVWLLVYSVGLLVYLSSSHGWILMYVECGPVDVSLRVHECICVCVCLSLLLYACICVCGCVFICDRWGSVSISPVRAGRLSPEAGWMAL